MRVHAVQTEVLDQGKSRLDERRAGGVVRHEVEVLGQGVRPAAYGQDDLQAAVLQLKSVQLLEAAVDAGAIGVPSVIGVVLQRPGSGRKSMIEIRTSAYLVRVGVGVR